MKIMELNKWLNHIENWCPAQLYYYFRGPDGKLLCIYLRWSYDDPWSAELYESDEDGTPLPDKEWEDLLTEEHHVPGIVTGFYTDEEYPFLMEKVLSIMRERYPELDFPNNQ